MELNIGDLTWFTIKDVFAGPGDLQKKSRDIVLHQLIQFTGAMFPINELKKGLWNAQSSKMIHCLNIQHSY